MGCEQYTKALIEAASAGAEPRGEPRAHLSSCSSCRGAFEQEQALFAAIDHGLRETVNAAHSANLFTGVRVRVAPSCAPGRQRFPAWALAGSAALVAALLLVWGELRRAPGSGAAQGGTQPQEAALPANPAPSIKQTPRARGSRPPRLATHFRRQGRGEVQPEVLVAAGEEEAFAKYVQLLRQKKEVAVAANGQHEGPLRIIPLEVAELQIQPLKEPLEGAGADPGSRQ